MIVGNIMKITFIIFILSENSKYVTEDRCVRLFCTINIKMQIKQMLFKNTKEKCLKILSETITKLILI